MNRQNHVPFIPAAGPRGAALLFRPPVPGRVPLDFIQAMRLIQGKPGDILNTRTPAQTRPALRRAVQPSANKWKSSFKPVDGDDDSEDQGTSCADLYDPYSLVLTDSQLKMPQSTDGSHCSSEQDVNVGHQRLSPDIDCNKKSRWDCSERGSHLFVHETGHSENKGGPLVPRVCSPDRLVHVSSMQRFPASYGGQRTNGEQRITTPVYRREMTAAVRLSPPGLQRDYQHKLGHVETGQDHIKLSPKVTRRSSSKVIVMDKSPITCDLCDVELANGQELESHLDSKSHWDTLEHIQQQNNYDDMVVAFLQEVMLYKGRQCGRAIEDSALQALQENDHMTKVEMFHCAACDIFVSTSASSVQTHITSQDHLSKTKEFEVQQRRVCLDKAETIMKELKPQFEHFMKGGSPFE